MMVHHKVVLIAWQNIVADIKHSACKCSNVPLTADTYDLHVFASPKVDTHVLVFNADQLNLCNTICRMARKLTLGVRFIV